MGLLSDIHVGSSKDLIVSLAFGAMIGIGIIILLAVMFVVYRFALSDNKISNNSEKLKDGSL